MSPKLSTRIVLILVVVLLGLAAPVAAPRKAAALAPSWPQVGEVALPPAPWRASAAPVFGEDEDVALLEVPVAADSFTSDYFKNENLGHFTSVWFGSDPELGTMRAYLRWDTPVIPGAYAGAAIYLPVAGTNVEQPMTARAFKLTGSWDEDSVPMAGVEPSPIASFTIPAAGGWVYFDATQLVRDMYEWHYSWRSVQLRGPEDGSQVAKAMYSREAGSDKSVATLVIAYKPDRVAPSCTLANLPTVSAASISLHATCQDDSANTSGVKELDYEMRAGEGPWTPVSTRPAGTYYEEVNRLQGGQTYSFRVRARDFAGNVSAWTADNAAVTTIESIPPVVRPGALFAVRWYPQGDMWRYLGGAYEAHDQGAPLSGLALTEFRYTDGSAVWRSVTNWDDFVFEIGKRYSFQVRAVDQAGNKSGWLSFGPVTVAKRVIYGSIADPYDRNIVGLPLVLDPAPANPVVTTGEGFAAYVYSASPTTIRSASPQFVLYPDAATPAEEGDSRHQKRWLYAQRNAVVNGDFEAPLAASWQVTGPVTLGPGPLVNSTQVARFDAAQGAASLKQTLVVPADVTGPTLSFLGRPHESEYPDQAARFTVTVTEAGKAPVIVFDQEITTWYSPAELLPQAFDLAQWAGKSITLAFNLTPNSSRSATYELDAVRVSPLPVDFAVRLSHANSRPAAGETIAFTLRVANKRGPETNIPVQITWPQGWTFVDSDLAPEANTDNAMTLRFTLAEGAQQAMQFRLRAPETAKGAVEVRAAIAPALAAQDYTSADNAWPALLLPGGRPSWLPYAAP